MKDEEQERIKFCREYFEAGCLCILNGDIDKKGSEVDDREAYFYYENNCRCSRNYTGSYIYE